MAYFMYSAVEQNLGSKFLSVALSGQDLSFTLPEVPTLRGFVENLAANAGWKTICLPPISPFPFFFVVTPSVRLRPPALICPRGTPKLSIIS